MIKGDWRPHPQAENLGVRYTDLKRYADLRGNLMELWRLDRVLSVPQMGYISHTVPGLSRGPHEHIEQADLFVFVSGTGWLFVWDPETKIRYTFDVGGHIPRAIYVPPGVPHGYMATGPTPLVVLTFPDKLYAGRDYASAVDEIRHEDNPDSPYKIPSKSEPLANVH